MTSAALAIGRTWYNSDDSSDLIIPLSQYQGFRLDTTHLRPNATTFWEFKDGPGSEAIRSLLRMFLRVQHLLLRSAEGQGAKAYIEWLPGDPACYLHVMYFPLDDACNINDECGRRLQALMDADAKACARRKPPEPWKMSDMVTCAGTWQSLLNVYGADGSADGCSAFSSTPPGIVDSELNAIKITHGHFAPMSTSDMSPDTFFYKFVPWFQESQFIEMPIRGSSELHSAAVLCRLSRAVPDTATMQDCSVWESILKRTQQAREHHTDPAAYAQWAITEVEHGLNGPQANYVAPPEDAINRYEMQKFPKLEHFDKRLSPMATWVASFLMKVEAFGFVYKQHLTLLKLFMGSMDCMREAPAGEIHYSAILAGPNSTSKSYLFTLLERMLIPETVDRATRRTENSLTYQKDQGCRVLIDHELPGDFFGDPMARKDSSARTAQTKEILTSHESRVEACQYVDGERKKVEARSRAHLCYLAATNDWSIGQNAKGDVGKDAALVSRFDVIFPTKSSVKNKCIWDVMAMERSPQEEDVAGMNALVEWCRTVQKCTYWILRLIHLGGIQPVNLDAAHIVIRRYSNASGSTASQRTVERVIIMARILCIITALQRHYAFNTSPRYSQVPQVKHMKELEPHLVVTAEQAKFAMGLFEADFNDQTEQPVRQALAKCQLRADPELGFSYLQVQGCNTAQQVVDELIMHMPSDADVTADSIHAFLSRLRGHKLHSHPFGPNLTQPHGVAEDSLRPKSNFYAMKGCSFHAAYVTKSHSGGTGSFESVLKKACHIGPPGIELTASVVPDFAHLLNVRCNEGEPQKYTKECAFIPKAAACMLGDNGQAAVAQAHRRQARVIVDEPVETVQTALRGGKPFDSAGCGPGDISYPRAYIEEVRKHYAATKVPASDALDPDTVVGLKRSLGDDCFYSSSKRTCCTK